MSKKSDRETVPQDIAKELQEAASWQGLRVADVWSDWLVIAEAVLQMLPVHAQSLSNGQGVANDPPELAEEIQRIRERYGARISHLERATWMLIELASPFNRELEITDILGPLYMEIGNPNTGAGQFFTPWDICRLMVGITHQDAPAEVLRRIEHAINQHPIHKDLIVMREGWVTLEIGQYVAETILPSVIQHYEPLTVHDPCCGSGGLLLASAAVFPRWMVAMGLVQFSGQDISIDCCRMTRINIMLYGLNGWGMRYAIALQQLAAVAPEQGALLDLAVKQDATGVQQLLFE